MVLCPIALAVGCARCPAVSICPLKSSIGDYKAKAPLATAGETPPVVKPK
jgi:hypothetical protein